MLHRQLSLHVLRTLAAEGFLGEALTPAETADMVVHMCRFSLAGPGFHEQQMRDPALTWQASMFLGRENVRPFPFPCPRSARAHR